MAKRPAKSSGSRISNIMGVLRGNFDFKTEDSNSTLALGSAELISVQERQKIIQGSLRATEDKRGGQYNTGANVISMLQTTLSKTGSERMENRKILGLMPEVDKAARLMIASTFAPNDLSAKEIPVSFDIESIPEPIRQKINKFATDFFQKKLNLKKAAPQWVYQFGYETGSSAFAIVPLRTFENIQENSYGGMESFSSQILDPIANESLLGFGDDSSLRQSESIAGLESYTNDFLSSLVEDNRSAPANIPSNLSELIKKIVGSEALKLTDNPSILQAKDLLKEKTSKRTKDKLKNRYNKIQTQTIVTVAPDSVKDKKKTTLGDPILMRLPPESVTVIHTPGDPNDHQGYLILLDQFGNPVNTTTMDDAQVNRVMNQASNQNNIFNQVYQAYGMDQGLRGLNRQDSMNLLYSQIVEQHLKKRINKAGYLNVELGNTDAVMRCMFARFMQQKQTRVLFLPKDLVSYMAFELDQHGYGVSRLDRIKFNLAMKMAVQVSKVLASIKAAMDKRNINVTFTDNLLEQPESIMNSILTEYARKSTMSFSVDPNIIQNQIIDKSVTVKAKNIPGMEEFDITNEPQQQSGNLDFDTGMTEYLDQQILHGLRVPPATMNSVGQDEYARSVTTTNLFFAMDVSLDQDIVIHHISDLLRKYATFSEPFIRGILEIIPSLDKKNLNSSIDSNKEVDKDEDGLSLPEDFTVEDLIETMTISLPRPNVAPSKAQFESLNAMIESIGQVVEALFPDELIGSNDNLSAAVKMIKAKFKTTNIRNYLESSGLTGLDVPEANFTEVMSDIINVQDALANIAELLKDKVKVNTPAEPTDPSLDEYK